MREFFKVFAAFALGAVLLGVSAFSVGAADLGGTQPAEISDYSKVETLSYLNKKTDLLLIRAVFDVIGHDEIVDELKLDAVRMADGVSVAEMVDLETKLLAEGSYMLVSLQYLVELGGAYFPDDRPYSDYANDALVRLGDLQRELVWTIVAGDDPLPIFKSANEILALTEGYNEVPASLAFFDERDDLVREAMNE